MAFLKDLLPPPKSTFKSFYDHYIDPRFKHRVSVSSEAEKSAGSILNRVPPYLNRAGFVPRKIGDFGDGGAFPEIHICQYPLDMGRDRSSKPGSRVLPVTVDAYGNVRHDAIVKQKENSNKIVYSQHKDLVPKILKNEQEEDRVEDEELQKEIEETRDETEHALEKIVNARLGVAKRACDSGSRFIKYMPSEQSGSFNSGAKERIIKMVERVSDPLEPAKFKHKRVPKASGPPPVPVLHSPPRKLTVEDYKDWKIPPCISNWKNPKGYTIPLDKRLAADGRGLQDIQMSGNFAIFAEALYAAEDKAREITKLRNKVCEEMMAKEEEVKKQKLRALAQRARAERTMVAKDDTGSSELIQREKIREERQRERERERRLEARDGAMAKKSKVTRDRERDISEKVALGMASTGGGRGEVMYDQRLFNQEKGMDCGLGRDDQYNIYDKGLFAVQPTLSTLYRPKKDSDAEMYGGAEEQCDKILKTDRFKPDKGFGETSDKGGSRDGPVEFEKVAENDPFGLDQFLTEVNKSRKAISKVVDGGSMSWGGSRRTRIELGQCS